LQVNEDIVRPAAGIVRTIMAIINLKAKNLWNVAEAAGQGLPLCRGILSADMHLSAPILWDIKT